MKFIISIGDCNGIGIEVMLKSLTVFHSIESNKEIQISIAGKKDIIIEYGKKINFDVKYSDNGIIINGFEYQIIECETKPEISFGKVDINAGKLSAEAVELAVGKVLNGEFSALITMPVSKSALYLAGWKYPGHTEMLADYCGADDELMILSTDHMRVALATVHIPISKVSDSLTKELISEKIKIFERSLRIDYCIDNPSVAVLGLNPHAGEDSALGDEEANIIEPAINCIKTEGINVSGPYPPDGFFAHGEYKNHDGILVMYHDQGLIPLKFSANGGGVNFTAGLKIVRTSPDHGTAFAIAGKGTANPQSTIDAFNLAKQVVLNRIARS